MLSEDPIRAGLNWYTYCNNNPIFFIDPLGLIPTPEEAVAMADHLFNLNDENHDEILSGKWYLDYIFSPPGTGLTIGVYTRTIDGVTEYALVNKGTGNNVLEYLNDAQQPFGLSVDMWLSMEFAITFVGTHAGYEVTMVGHSKGGAEATVNAIVTGTNCITFNPMVANIDLYCTPIQILLYQLSGATMTHYVVCGDILNSLFGIPWIGNVFYLDVQHVMPWYTFILPPILGAWKFIDYGSKNHGLASVQAALDQARANGKLK